MDNFCLFERIQCDIRELITTGKIKPGAKIPSVNSIKEKYKVSHITALRALKELALENHVEFIKGRGYFACQGNRSGRTTGVVACLMRPPRLSTIHDNYFNDINQAVVRTLMNLRYQVLYPSSNIWLAKLPVLTESLQEILNEALAVEANVDGFIVEDRIDDETLKKLIKANRKPVVLVNRSSGLPIDSVTADNVNGAGKAADIALKMGYSHFIVAKPGIPNSNNEERFSGFTEALRMNEVSQEAITILDDFNVRPFEESIESILRLLSKITTKCLIFSPMDVFARAVTDALNDTGVALGKDVGVLGFEGMGYATLSAPAVTTFDVHPDDIGVKTAELLHSRIIGENLDKPGNHTVPCSVQLGDTL